MLKYNSQLAWFSRLVLYPARKRSGSILTTPEPARGWSCGAASRNTMTHHTSTWPCSPR